MSFLVANADLDLAITRPMAVSPMQLWQALTQADLVKQWWCPRPWTTPICDIDLRPGGIFHTVMQSPEGEQFAYPGCILEIVPERRLIMSMALGSGFRPLALLPDLPITVVMEIEPAIGGVNYRARALHRDITERKKHEEMGFFNGWGTMVEQLEAVVKAQ